jgi:hypothetical protein
MRCRKVLQEPRRKHRGHIAVELSVKRCEEKFPLPHYLSDTLSKQGVSLTLSRYSYVRERRLEQTSEGINVTKKATT